MTPELLMPFSPRVLLVWQPGQKLLQKVVSSSPLPPRTHDQTGFYSNLILNIRSLPYNQIKHKRKHRDSLSLTSIDLLSDQMSGYRLIALHYLRGLVTANKLLASYNFRPIAARSLEFHHISSPVFPNRTLYKIMNFTGRVGVPA